jgi:hypothetical protein
MDSAMKDGFKVSTALAKVRSVVHTNKRKIFNNICNSKSVYSWKYHGLAVFPWSESHTRIEDILQLKENSSYRSDGSIYGSNVLPPNNDNA